MTGTNHGAHPSRESFQTGPHGDSIRDQIQRAFAELGASLEGLRPEDVNRDLGPETNSIAVLVHHTVDAARSILHDVAGDPIPRNRAAAFQVADATLEDLQVMLAAWSVEMDALLDRAVAADPGRLVTRFREAPAAWWLLHVLGHTKEHAAHAQLTRQILDRR